MNGACQQVLSSNLLNLLECTSAEYTTCLAIQSYTWEEISFLSLTLPGFWGSLLTSPSHGVLISAYCKPDAFSPSIFFECLVALRGEPTALPCSGYIEHSLAQHLITVVKCMVPQLLTPFDPSTAYTTLVFASQQARIAVAESSAFWLTLGSHP